MKRIATKAKDKVGFGKMIRERRRALGVSEETAAERSNRSDREVRNIELGNSEPRLEPILRICRACEVHVGEPEEFTPEKEYDYE